MGTTNAVRAYPRKTFFLDMFTRDISLEACILDLIDNAMDALIRASNIDLSPRSLRSASSPHSRPLPEIRVDFSPVRFQITDTCGGIPKKDARFDVFCFGHGPESKMGKWGVYGIGLKRAIFKIGKQIQVDSKTEQDSFRVTIDVEEWKKKDESLEDWTFSLGLLGSDTDLRKPGTSITIRELNPEVRARLKDPRLEQTLRDWIGTTYSFFLGQHASIMLNGKLVRPVPIPTGDDAGIERFDQNGVSVEIIASLGRVNEKGQWTSETAGWYIICNGRVVLFADKSEQTGWTGNVGQLPTYQPKHRGFVGLVFFYSEDPGLLPWTTTKRGLNRESPIYLRTLTRMTAVARPVITTLDGFHKEGEEKPIYAVVQSQVRAAELADLAQRPATVFSLKASMPKTTERVSFTVETSEVERLRKHLKQPAWKNSKIGKWVWDYFLRTECPE